MSKRIAVIGSGISGLGAAYALAPHHQVTLFEKNPVPGGHAATVDIDYDGEPVTVDTGFIVYNEPRYPNLVALFGELGVPTEASCMSFAASFSDGSFEWSVQNPRQFLGQGLSLLRPRFLRLMWEVVRFNRLALRELAAAAPFPGSLGAFVETHRFSDGFREAYIYPMAGAIWSMPPAAVVDFPLVPLLRFFDNHRLLQLRQWDWRTVTGGSRVYVERLLAAIRVDLRLATPVLRVRRRPGGAEVIGADGGREVFDEVVIASHSDQALAMLADPDEDERRILGAIGYRENAVYLHRDASHMPRRRELWASWNAVAPDRPESRDEVAVTYWMNRLQNLDPAKPLFITLNPQRPPREEDTFGTYSYAHPQYDAAAIRAQGELDTIQGRRHTWYCGAWCSHGFHEDGLSAGLAVAEALGGRVSWRTPPHLPEPGRRAA